ncbi:hypothetical protein DM587_07340 [Vibrio fluvialis]|nr:hypothetical protein DM587_07340 [Vibrio fluvialis]
MLTFGDQPFVFYWRIALLRGEQRNVEAVTYHLNHLNQRIAKMPRVATPLEQSVMYVVSSALVPNQFPPLTSKLDTTH